MSQLTVQRATLAALESSIHVMEASVMTMKMTAETLKASIQAMEDEVSQPVQTAEIQAPATEMPMQPAPTPKVWSVHDCHTHCVGKDKGLWARGAVANGSYGVCVTPSEGSKDTANMKVTGPLGEVTVSSRRWNNVKDISIKDTLYMGDTVLGKVFQGKVVAQPINGPFASVSAKEHSFLFSLDSNRDMEKMAREVEVTFKVEWVEIADLTENWKTYLGTSSRTTVSRLTTAPPA
jgi:hypothetical protein